MASAALSAPQTFSIRRIDNIAFQEEGRERLNGGAERFYALIEIKPWVYEQLGEKPKQVTIWGHSYGGLFVLYNLFKHLEAYQQYFSADPSLWWQKGEMINYW
ncbi:MAG: alpha/beta hydrolase-fold protein [Psychrobacter sp.]